MKKFTEKEPVYAQYKSVLTLENLEDIRKVCKSYLYTIFINIFFGFIAFILLIVGSTFLPVDLDKANSLFLVGYFLLIPFGILLVVNLISNIILILKANFYKTVSNDFATIFIFFVIGIFIGIPSIIGCFLVFKKIKEIGLN